MALKSKFERIDQSKLKQGARDVLAKMKEKSENFTNAEVNKKIEPAIDKLIERLKKENPDALKKASATRTRKPKATAKKKATKKAPAKTSGAKRETVMTVAKRIRKDGEKWQDALKRAKSEMGKDTKKKVSAVKTEVDKLKKLIEKDAVLKGFANSELQRDAVRKAKPRGKRKTTTKGETTNQYGTFKNKVGRTYWESRENRSDRYAPKYPKNKPFLEMGGDVTDAQDLSIANADFLVMAKGGMITSAPEYHKVRNAEYDRRVKSGKIKDTDENFEKFDEMYFDELVKKGKIDIDNYFAKGGEIDAFTMSMVKGVDDGISEVETKDLKARMEKGGKLYYQQDGVGKAKYTISYYDGKKTHKDGSPFYDIATFKNKKDLKSYIEKLESEGYKKRFAKGGEITKTGNKGSARWEMKITDEEGNTSSIYAEKKSDLLQYKKMYLAKGGTLESKFDGYETMYKYALANNFTPRQLAEELRFMTNLQNKGDKELYDFLNNLSNMFPDTPISEFKKGGSIPQSAKDEFYQLRYDDEDFADQYGEDDLQEWYEEQGRFAKGGRLKSALMRDRKYYNKNEAWERAYSKGKNRRGYKENGGVIENSIQSYQNHYKGFPSYEDGGTIADSTQHFRIMETDTPIYKEGGQIDMDL